LSNSSQLVEVVSNTFFDHWFLFGTMSDRSHLIWKFRTLQKKGI